MLSAGAWKQQRMYYRQTVMMLCDIEPSHKAGQDEGVTATEFMNPVKAFVLLPAAHLELVHAKEFEALESKMPPSGIVFLVRIFMPLADFNATKAEDDETAIKLFQQRSRAESGEEEVHGVEMYLCPETDQETEKLFTYLLHKSSEATPDSIPLPSGWRLDHVKPKARHIKESKRRSQKSHGDLARTSANRGTANADEDTDDEVDGDGVDVNEDIGALMEGNLRVKAHDEMWFYEHYCVLTTDGVLKLYEDLDAYLLQAPWQHSTMCRGASVGVDAGLDETEGYSIYLVDALGHRYVLHICCC
jgi:hypothetical protein